MVSAAMLGYSTVLAKSDNETGSADPLHEGDNGKKNCDNISIIINHKHNSCNDNGSGHSGHKGKSKSKSSNGNGDLLRETEANQKLADSETLAASKGQISLDSFSVKSLNATHYRINFTSGE